MDLNVLTRLGQNGFAGVPADQLGNLAVWCRDFAEASGDARYSSVGQALGALADWWERHDEHGGGIPVLLKDQIESKLRNELPAILAQSEPSDGASLARRLREQIEGLLLEPDDWVAQGYMQRRQ